MSLTELGFRRPTYDEIVESKIQTAIDLFGDDIETSEQTPLGKFSRIGAKELSEAYEDLENAYYASFPNTASGVSLDRLCAFAGISRNPATYAEIKIKVYGDSGTEVDEIIVSGEDNEITFHNIEPFIIPESGVIEVIVECETSGTIGNLSVIDETPVNAISGVDKVEYAGVEKLAEDTESDYKLRSRFAQAIEGAGGSNANAIRTAILRIDTVKSVSITTNNENTTVAGRPPHSFECYVYGGEEKQKEIAEAIFDKAPIGIVSCSTSDSPVITTIYDEGGTPHTIAFSHTTNIPIFISATYKKNNKFELDGETQIKNALIDYINNLGVGGSVPYSSLFGHIYDVDGVRDVTELKIGTVEGNLTTNNINIESWQVPITDSAKISLTGVEV